MSANTSVATSVVTSLVIINAANAARRRREKKEQCAKEYKEDQCHSVCVSSSSSEERSIDFWTSNYMVRDTNSCTGTVSEPYQKTDMSSQGTGVIVLGVVIAAIAIFVAFVRWMDI